MKIIFFGATKFSEDILNDLLKKGFQISCIFTIPKNFNISYSKDKVKNFNFSDLRLLAKRRKIRSYEVNSIRGKRISDYYEVINDIKPDVMIVAGWYYMIPKKIRALAKYGAWGMHASLLPKYAGGAPLVWAMINGEKKTGVSLFRLSDGIDDGDIIFQKAFPIKFEDTIKEVYARATMAAKEILVKALKNIKNLRFKPQDRSKLEIYPQRRPEDGEINLNQSFLEIYNFIRAQSFPYPGAFIKGKDGKKVIIDKVKVFK